MKTRAHIESCNHSWQRGPPFYEDPPLLTTPLPPTPPLLILLFCFFGWMGDRATIDALLFLMISRMYKCWASGTWCMFYTKRCQVYWGLKHDVVFAGTLIWYHTHKQAQHNWGPVDQHTHVNIYLHQLLRAHSNYLYYTEWIIHWHQKFTFHNVFSFQRLFTCQSHIYWLTRFFLWNANNNDRNGVNKQNTHTNTHTHTHTHTRTPNAQRKIFNIWKG